MSIHADSSEYVSRLVDGDLEEALVDEVLDILERNPQSRQCWERYHLISDAFRNHLSVAVDPLLATRVRNAVEAEEMPRAPLWIPVARQLAGLAMAASIAAVAVLGVYRFTHQADSGTMRLADAKQTSSATSVRPVQVQAVDPKLQDYLIDHSAQASASGMPGLLPYVRLVGHSFK